MEKSLKIAGDVLTVATKLSGLGSSSSSKQNGLMLSAVSAGLNLGSTVMKDGRKRGDGGGGGGRRPAQAPVVMTPQHNNGEFCFLCPSIPFIHPSIHPSIRHSFSFVSPVAWLQDRGEGGKK